MATNQQEINEGWVICDQLMFGVRRQIDQYYLRARYYDQGSGRFTSMDTWMGVNHDPQTLHKYMYTHADPINNTDPTGNYTLSGLSTALNIRGILSIASRTHAGMSWMDTIINGDPANFDAKAIGAQVILSLLGGKVAEKFLGMVSRKFRKGCNSFEDGTLVHAESGLVPIEEIEIGDLVWAYNEDTGESALQEVVHLIRGEGEKEIVDIKLLNGEIIRATNEHPFYVVGKEKGWVDAEDLSTLNKLLSLRGDLFEIEKLDKYRKDTKVYNLTVANDHTYYVGEMGILNHNSSCKIPRAIDEEHLFRGEIKRRTAKGFHSTFEHPDNARVNRRLWTLPNGVYKAWIEVCNERRCYRKKSTMFPDRMHKGMIRAAIYGAWNNNKGKASGIGKFMGMKINYTTYKGMLRAHPVK